MDTTRSVVVGGGPAGMMLGLLLARAGIEVTVLERHRDFLRDFRGDTVHPSTLRLLDDLGLGERFAALPSSRLREMRMVVDGVPVVAADFGRIPGRHKHIAMVPQWDFLELLASAAAEEPGFTLRRCSEVTGLLRDGSAVVGVRYRDERGADRELRAPLTVGCDGRGSLVRRESGLRTQQFTVPMDVWQVRVPKDGDPDKDGRVFARFDPGNVAVTMDRDEYFQAAYLIPKGRDEQVRAEGLGAFRDRLGALFGWSGDQLEAIRSWDDVKLLEVSMNRLPRWHAPGVLCLGDAAHTMSPVGGMGVNLAVQDAVAAARLLAPGLRKGAVSRKDLASVQRRRQFPTVVAQRSQLGEHDMLLRPALDGTLSATSLPLLLRMLRRMPALRGVTAYVGGVGVRRERAPDFARRAAA